MTFCGVMSARFSSALSAANGLATSIWNLGAVTSKLTTSFALSAMRKKWGTIFNRPREKKNFKKVLTIPEPCAIISTTKDERN